MNKLHRRIPSKALGQVTLSMLGLGLLQVASGDEFVVQNDRTSGAGSFAEAVQLAENTLGADTIRFDPGFFNQPREICCRRDTTSPRRSVSRGRVATG